MSNAMRKVDAEHGDGSAANGGAADQYRTVPAEVAPPFMSAGIEEPRAFARFWIDASQVRAFVVVVCEAS
jgi:hypothetical protein